MNTISPNARPAWLLLGWLLPLLALVAPPLPAAEPGLRLPHYTRTKLKNGLVLLLMEQREVPIVSFNVLVLAGSITDPEGKEGLASVTADLLRRGTTTRSADQIAAELDFVGGTMEFETELDYTRGAAEFLKKDLTLGLELLADVLRNPAFPESEVDKLLSRRIDSLKQEKDEPPSVIRPYYRAFLFRTHPYGRPVNGDERSLAAIRREDVVRLYEGRIRPQNTTIAVVGDFERQEMERRLTEMFDGWEAGTPLPVAELPEPGPVKGRKLLLVDKPDATQTFFIIGNVGIERTNRDRAGIDVVNTVFGGRFTSMLNDALRVNSGLTYGARSIFERHAVPGAFAIFTFTPNETTTEAIDMTLEILGQLHREGISDEQLKSARAYLKGQYPPRIETSDQLAALLTELDYFRLDAREINEYFDRLDILTREDARRIIRQHFPKDNLALVLIGKADEIRERVKKYAPVIETRPISQVGFR